MSKKMGRKKMPLAERRNNIVATTMNNSELKQFDKVVAATGLSHSVFIRLVLMKAMKQFDETNNLGNLF